MKVNQIYTIVNSVAKQMWGEDAITATDLTGLISMGKSVLSSETNRDLFLNTLVDRIGKTVIRTLDLELDFPNLMVTDFEWGSIIQKINVQPQLSVVNKSYQITEEGFTPNQFDVNPITATQTFFTDADTWEFDYTIPDVLLKSAFRSESEFNAFITAITAAVSDSMTMALNNMAYMAIDNFAAEKLKANNGVVNLLAMYNTQFASAPLTQADCITSPEFCRYASMIMNNYIKYMAKPSKLYNAGGMVRATARDNMHILIAADFASSMQVYLESDTYWNEYVKLPNYKEYVCLQGTGNVSPNWIDNTTINVIPSSANDGDSAIKQTGIIGIFADRQAIATGYTDMYSGTDRNNRNRYTNFTYMATKQYINDLSENGVIFIAAPQNGVSLDKSTLTFASSAADAQALTATTSPAGETVTWKSSKNTVATVSNGTVTPVGAGTCTITATSEIDGLTYTATCTVTVGGTNSKSR